MIQMKKQISKVSVYKNQKKNNFDFCLYEIQITSETIQ